MKKFEFEFATSLKVKRLMEDVKKFELARAIERKNCEQRRLQDIIDKKDTLNEEIIRSLEDTIAIENLRQYSTFFQRLRLDEENQEKVLSKAELQYKESQTNYMASKMARDIFEKLKEKQYSQYLLEFNKMEQAQSDEVAINSFCRRRR